MRNRMLLLGLTVAAWLCIKTIDYLLPWSAFLVLLCGIVLVMITHTVWMLAAQRREARMCRDGRSQMSGTTSDTEWLPSVDILIPAKNEARVIEKTVRNFFKLDYPDYTVCVIDDASDDSMPQVLDRLCKEFPALKCVRRPAGSVPGKSAGLNDALPMCRSEVIAVFDADAYVEPDFLRKILPVLQPEQVGAVQAQKRIYRHQTSLLPECQASEYALDTYFQVGRDLIGGAVELRGNGELMKRSALIDVGGWNNKAITDDLDLTMRLLLAKWNVKFSPDTVVWEEAVTTLQGLIRQRRRWAEGSIRRYLDYIFPLNSLHRLSIVEKIDILAFLSEFAVPGLMLLEILSEIFRTLAGEPDCAHPGFLLFVALLTSFISAVNLFIAIRLYRPEKPLFDALGHTGVVNAYIYAHWVPCVLVSFVNIMFKQEASKWHRTEHLGGSA